MHWTPSSSIQRKTGPFLTLVSPGAGATLLTLHIAGTIVSKRSMGRGRRTASEAPRLSDRRQLQASRMQTLDPTKNQGRPVCHAAQLK
eukprot:1034100-Rhodomonas_salina.3